MLTLLELLQVALGCQNGHTLGKQIIVGKAGSYVYNVAFAALVLNFGKKDNFHFILLFSDYGDRRGRLQQAQRRA